MAIGETHNQTGLEHYGNWEIDEAIHAFQAAVSADSENAEFHLNLARAFARSGSYHEAIQALGEYLRTETDGTLTARYERLFSSALDEVEESMIAGMRELDLSIKLIGKAIQMWLEYRITIGRKPLRTPKPEIWAGALVYTTIKVNFERTNRATIANTFQISERALKDKFNELVDVLDIMPADYRYFVGEENPLDKLVEAAQIMEDLDRKFQED
jgi:tetratricopeptide (TPR) repeat protein